MGYAEQARLSEQHRAAQARLQAIVAADTAKVFPLLDVNNLDKSFGQYFDGMKQVVNARRTLSSSLGASYFNGIRNDAGLTSAFSPILAGAVNEEQLFTSLLVTGPISMKKNMANGASAQQARNAALTSTIKANQRHVINGGRETILNSVKRDKGALGWARLTDGKPCAFCALLASRGPAYKTETTGGFKSHDGCGCTPVPVFDFAAPWPGDAEKYRAAYDENISGKFPGGDGNNKAVQAWRKYYDDAFLGGGTTVVPTAANTAVKQAVASVADLKTESEWLAAFREARAALPEKTTRIGRVGGRDLTASEAAELAVAKERQAFVNDWDKRWRASGTNLPAQEALKREFKDVTGLEPTLSRYGYVEQVTAEHTRTFKTIRDLETIERGAVDYGDEIRDGLRGKRISVGNVANEHLDAVIGSGKVIGQELDRRMAARIDAFKATRPSGAAEIAARKEIEAKIVAANKRIEEGLEQARRDAERLVDIEFPNLTPEQREYWISGRVLDSKYIKGSPVTQARFELTQLQADLKRAIAAEKEVVGDILPGTKAWADIQREEVLKILSEVREMGGPGANYLTRLGGPEVSGNLKAAMDFADSSYPAGWLERLRERFPNIEVGSASRGYNSGGNVIKLSTRGKTTLTGDNGSFGVAVHELGHSMEKAVPGLSEMEWAYHSRRALIEGKTGLQFEQEKWLGSGYRKTERTVFDEWREAYTGKRYEGGGEGSWEVFTTGVESLMSGSEYLYSEKLGFDTEFRDWLLGVLSVL